MGTVSAWIQPEVGSLTRRTRGQLLQPGRRKLTCDDPIAIVRGPAGTQLTVGRLKR